MLETMAQTLQNTFNVVHITVEDQAYFHRGHHPDRQGGHYAITLVTDDFKPLNSIARHQAVYTALDMPKNSQIHALSLKTFTVEEWHNLRPQQG